MKLLRIVWKMRNRESPSISVQLITLNCRIMRVETGLRPPPGGPIAANKIVSMIFLKVRSLRSYQP